jgi:diguanylate cyclase (GGDEF)-like protein
MHFRELRTKLTVHYAGAFAIALIVIAAAVQIGISQNVGSIVADQMAASGTVFDRVWNLRSQQLRNAAEPLAHDFGFRSAVATGDAATAESALENLKQRLHLKVGFIVNIDGSIIGLSSSKERSQAAALLPDLANGFESGTVRLGGNTYHAVASAISAPDLLGWAVFARELDGAEMLSHARLSAIPLHAEIARHDRDGIWRYDGSNKAVQANGLVALLDRSVASHVDKLGKISAELSGDVVFVKSLRTAGSGEPAALVMRYSTSAAIAAYSPLKITVAVTGLLGLILMALASSRLALGITSPIAALRVAAKQLENGNIVNLVPEGNDEIGDLARSFNAMASGIQEREKRISHMAFHDALTGLPNRVLFNQQLDYLIQQSSIKGEEIAVLCIDLDHFKSVNDTLGHPIGDKLLKECAKRLAEVSENAFFARLGGDEFAVLIRGNNAQHDAEKLARLLVSAIAMPLEIEDHPIAISASIGIAIPPFDGDTSELLMKNADLALYRAKEEGRNGYRFFEAEMNARAQARRAIEMDLRVALGRGELELYFQPLFDLTRNEYSAFEALLRWNHPTRGQVSPLEFIPIAEDTGLIVPIGEWVIQEACRHAAKWGDDIRVAVNVSTLQFRNPGLNATVLQALAASGLAPNRLEIEITESIFLDNNETILNILHGLRSMGVRIALDDFGTGYSSLSYLRSFPFDKIKIDRSFIIELLSGNDAAAVVRAITDLARALGMETTAEGVEEQGQLDELRKQGCTNVQGFLFSRAVPAGEIAALLGQDALRRAA